MPFLNKFKKSASRINFGKHFFLKTYFSSFMAKLIQKHRNTEGGQKRINH